MSDLLKEAFKELAALKEDIFSFDSKGIHDLDRFLHLDDVAPDFVSIVDVEAKTEDDLKPSYEDQVVLKCCTCGQLIYKDPKEVCLDAKLERANVEECCPHCNAERGYEVVGQVAPFVDTEHTTVEVDGEKIQPDEMEQAALKEDLNFSTLKNYFDEVDDYQGWTTVDKAAEDLEMDPDEVAGWINEHPSVGYILTFGDTRVILCFNAPPYEDIAAELGVEEPDLLEEDFQRATVETGDTALSMEATEEGKITVTSEPRKPVKEEEMIVPLADETIEEVETEEDEGVAAPESEEAPTEEILPPLEGPANSEVPAEEVAEDADDIDIDALDEESFNSLGESYFKKVYDNVDSFQVIGGSTDNSKILLEGLITFNSGKQARTQFLFEGIAASKDGRLKFVGENKQLSPRKNAFTVKGSLVDRKLIAESFTYNYRALDSKTGKGYSIYGTIKK